MKKLTDLSILAIIGIALMLTGCATNLRAQAASSATDTTAPAAAPTSNPDFAAACLSPTGNLMADFQRCLTFVQADIQVALDDATAAKDDVGVQCHQAGLALVSVLTSAQPKVVGLVSGAEALRVANRSAINNLPLWYAVKDKCAAVYNPAQVFRPLTAGLGVALP